MTTKARTCNICKSETSSPFSTAILKKYAAPFLQCQTCGFLFADDPHWLNEAYAEAITTQDIGIMSRNIANAKITSALIFFYFNKDGVFLDSGGGVGIFTRLMRDRGYNFRWEDPHANNCVAKGFEADSTQQYELLTSFEVIEHLSDPLAEISALAKRSESLLLSTQILPDPLPNIGQWMYYGFDHGQHISFYTIESLEALAKRLGLRLYTDGHCYHLLTSHTDISSQKFKLLVKIARRLPLDFFRNRSTNATDDYKDWR